MSTQSHREHREARLRFARAFAFSRLRVKPLLRACLGLLVTLWCTLSLPTPAHAELRLVTDGAPTTFDVVSWRDLPFRTVIRQQYDYSCGSAALATLLRFHYGLKLTEADVFRAMYEAGDQEKIKKVGFSLLDMKRYLEARGLRADGFKMSLAALVKSETPAIALIDHDGYKHFVVIKGARGSEILIGDPTLGLQSYPQSLFQKMWNGIVFAIPKSADTSSFNRDDEWKMKKPVSPEIADLSRPVDHLTREIEPLYQITPIFSLDWALQ
jgi:predicted double-glycine peptidase